MADGDQPRVSDAAIGAAIGVALIWLGTLFSSRLIRWPLFALGVIFVVVMCGFILVASWERLSPPVLRRLARARGHVREDPQLGTLTRDVIGRCWSARWKYRALVVHLVIEGEAEPLPRLLAHARRLVADFDRIADQIDDFLAAEAREWAKDDPERAAEVAALRLRGLLVQSTNGQDRIILEFDGPDEDIYWSCEHVDGELSDLQYDS